MSLVSRLRYGWPSCTALRNQMWNNIITKHSVGARRRLVHSESRLMDNMPQLMTIRNGTKGTGTFSNAEMHERIIKLRNSMANENIDGVLFTSQHNINYYSDFLVYEFGRPYGLVVTQDKVVTITPKADGGLPWRVSVADDNVVYTDWQQDNYYRGVHQELGHLKGKIGCEFDHINVERLKKLQNALPDSTLVDVGESTMYLRMIKSDEEIALIKEGARIAVIGGGAMVEALAEGVGEHEIALHATEVMVKEIAESRPNMALLDTFAWFQSGIMNTDNCHNPITSRKVQKGEVCSLNCFPSMAGYFSALERNIFLDHASDEALRVWEANCEVFETGKKLIRPGIKCKDVAHAMNEVYEKHNLLQYRLFGYGHSFGVLNHYYGREAALEFREDIETVLEPNMVVSMEPMVALPETDPAAGGYREHDMLVVTEDGAETITRFPYGPEHMIIKK